MNNYLDQDISVLEPGPDIVRPNKQRSPEWFAMRRSRFTGSEVWKLTVEPRDAASKKLGLFGETAMTYIREVAAEMITGETKEIWAPALQWGLDHEDDGKVRYTEVTGKQVIEHDFWPFEDYGGGSVDGLIGEDGVLELKCPHNAAVHLENLLLAAKKPNEAFIKSERRDLYWQVMNNMMCTGRTWAHFVSYDPRYPKDKQLSVITINYVPEDGEFILGKIKRAKALRDEMLAELMAA